MGSMDYLPLGNRDPIFPKNPFALKFIEVQMVTSRAMEIPSSKAF
jgi:hypothetical protein